MVAKAHANEAVGVFARAAGKLQVVEYSEMDPAEAASTDPGACLHDASRPNRIVIATACMGM